MSSIKLIVDIVPIDVDGSEQGRVTGATADISLCTSSAKAAGGELPEAPASMAVGDPAYAPFCQEYPRFFFCIFWILLCFPVLVFLRGTFPSPPRFLFVFMKRHMMRRIYCRIPKVSVLPSCCFF